MTRTAKCNQYFHGLFFSHIDRFTEVLQNIRKRHSTVIETLAQVINCFILYANNVFFLQGYMEFSDSGSVKEYEESQVQYFLNRFYLSRISIRLLIYQHSTLSVKTEAIFI